MAEDKKAFQRQMVEKEIIETEKQFGVDLSNLQKFRKILQEKRLLPPDIIASIFLNVDALVQINGVILEELATKSIGEVFLAQAPFLKMFSMYCEKHEAALATWKRCKSKKGSPLLGFDDALSKSHKGLFLHDFLIKPVQRICKYPLLFRNLLELIPPGPDYKVVEEVFAKINLVVSGINQDKAKVENKKAINHYSEMLAETPPNWDLHDNPGREFIREIHGWVIVLKRTQVATVQRYQDEQWERQFLLFNDKLIVTQKKKDKLVFKRDLELQFMTIMDNEPTFKFKDVSFLLEDRRNTGEYTFLFFFAKNLEKQSVFKDIKNLTTQARLGNLKKAKSTMLNSGGNPINPVSPSPPSQSPTSTGGGSETESASPTSSPHTTNPKEAISAVDYSDHLNIDFGELSDNPLCELNANLFLPNQGQGVALGHMSPQAGRVVIRPSRGGPGAARGGPRGAGRAGARGGARGARGGPRGGGPAGRGQQRLSYNPQMYEAPAQYEAYNETPNYEQANYEQPYNENNTHHNEQSYNEANTFNEQPYNEANNAYNEQTYHEANSYNESNHEANYYENAQHQQNQAAYSQNNQGSGYTQNHQNHEHNYGETPNSYHGGSTAAGGGENYGEEAYSEYGGEAYDPNQYQEFVTESYVEGHSAQNAGEYGEGTTEHAGGQQHVVGDEFDAMDRDQLIAECRRLRDENRQLQEMVEFQQQSAAETDWGTVSFGGHGYQYSS